MRTTWNFGFSWIGMAFLTALFVPNILWARSLPPDSPSLGESPVLHFLERIGQAASCCTLLFCRDLRTKPWSALSWWLVLAASLMILYELWWIRFFSGTRTKAEFYRPFFGIPLAGAVLPVAAIACLGLYAQIIWILVAAILLGIGHIGIHAAQWARLGFPR